MAPGDEAPQMHRSLEAASAQADYLARVHTGTKVHVYQLRSIGNISYLNTPSIFGHFKPV